MEHRGIGLGSHPIPQDRYLEAQRVPVRLNTILEQGTVVSLQSDKDRLPGHAFAAVSQEAIQLLLLRD